MMEEWRDIEGYEGLYQVSNLGRVKSLNYNRTGKEEVLKPYPNNKEYLQVRLCKNGKRETYYVHRLVAIMFIANPDNLPEVNHKDENPSNNNVENLEWCTREYNNNYGTRNERASESISNAMRGKKLTNEHKNKIAESNSGSYNHNAKKIRCITTGEIFNTITEASEIYNVNRPHISECCNGKRKSAGKHPITGEKLLWEFME